MAEQKSRLDLQTAGAVYAWLRANAAALHDKTPQWIRQEITKSLGLPDGLLKSAHITYRLTELGIEYKRQNYKRRGETPDPDEQVQGNPAHTQAADIKVLADVIAAHTKEIWQLRQQTHIAHESLCIKLGQVRDIATAAWMKLEEATTKPDHESSKRRPIGGLLVFPPDDDANEQNQGGNGSPEAFDRRNGTHGAQG